jgi:enoyl-CoA hydratase/carnithine racemase
MRQHDLYSDWVVMGEGEELVFDSPDALGGAVWRIGGRVLGLLGRPPVAAAEALALGLCDEVGDGADFLVGRSAVALDAASALIGRRGGDALERATFGWLFATGNPARGLSAFLEKRRPRFETE